MKEIDGPVFCLFAVVSKRPCDLEFDRPLVRNEEIWIPLGLNISVVIGKLIQVASK